MKALSLEEIEEKRKRLLSLMEENDYKYVVIGRRDNFAWFTGGGDNKVIINRECGEAFLVIDRENIRLIAYQMDGQRFLDEQVQNIKLEYIFLKWYEGPLEDFVARLIKGKKTLSDVLIEGAYYSPSSFYKIHYPLTISEIQRLRWLGEVSEKILKSAADFASPGMKEYEIAGFLLNEYAKLGIECDVLMVGSDERIFKYRHPLPSEKKIQEYLFLHTSARKWGLHANITRLVSFGKIPQEIQRRYEIVTTIEGVVFSLCKVGTRLLDVLNEQKRLYKELGFEEEWEKHFHGGLTGYIVIDTNVCMDPNAKIELYQPFDWFITITGVKVEELTLITPKGLEVCSVTGIWPTKRYEFDTCVFDLPVIFYK
jgi:antitoxin VapB